MTMLRAAVIALSALILIPAGALAQALSPELRALDAQLPGELVNDPSRIDWDSYGPDFFAESIVDESIPGGGAARRFHVNKATEFIYTAGTNIPLIRNVKRGKQITIGFYARTIEARTENGKGVLRVRFQKDSPPYPGFGEETLEIGTDWDWYEVTVEAEQGLRRKDGIVAIQFGRTKQILEIGQAIIVSGASAIASAAPQSRPEPAPAVAAQLPRPLRGRGTLLNDPTDRKWGFAATVESASIEKREDSSIWLGKATRLATTADDETAGVDALVDIASPIAEGDEILIALAAKSSASPSEGQGSSLDVRLFAPSAGEIFSRSTIELGSAWQLVRLVTKAPRALRSGEAVFGLRIVGPGQGVDIGPVYVIKANGS